LKRRKCSCAEWGVTHLAPWAPCCPDIGNTGTVSAESLAYSGRTGVDTKRSDYDTWRLQRQESSDYHKRLLAELRGPEAEKIAAPATYEDLTRICHRCGQEVFGIRVDRGGEVKVLDFCPCQFSPELLAKQAELDRARALRQERESEQERQIRHKREQANRAAELAAALELKASNCAAAMLRLGPKCVADQSFPECGVCQLSRRARRTSASRPAGYVPPIREVAMQEI